jgi:hypothetical protein
VVPLVPIAVMLSCRGPPCYNVVSGWMGWLIVFFPWSPWLQCMPYSSRLNLYCLDYRLFSVVPIGVRNAMCFSGLWFYLRNIESDKQ